MSQHQKTNTLSHLFPFHSLSEPLSRPLGEQGGGGRPVVHRGVRRRQFNFLFLVTFLFFKQAAYLES